MDRILIVKDEPDIALGLEEDQREQVAVARARLAILQPPARSQTTQVARHIWAGNVAMGGGGRPSPDGRYLSFTERETGDLAVRDLITNTNRRVTNTGGWVASGDYPIDSVISPDGRQVAYEWFVQKEFKNELRVASIATDELVHSRVVLRTERNDYLRHLAWTPDADYGNHTPLCQEMRAKCEVKCSNLPYWGAEGTPRTRLTRPTASTRTAIAVSLSCASRSAQPRQRTDLAEVLDQHQVVD